MKVRMKWLGMTVMVLGMGMGKVWATNTPIDATITVTPVANVSLAIAPTTYAYGALLVSASSITATALVLSNSGDVDVKVDKRITTQSNPLGWTAGTTQSTDHYVLWVTTATLMPAAGEFTAATQFGLVNAVTNLTGAAATQPVINVAGGGLAGGNLWFKMGLPTK